MGKFRMALKNEFWRNIPLFLCGVFLIYIAAFDESIFQLVAYDLTSRVLVTLGTVLAAGIPMFFAVGTIKQSVLIGRETVYFYERLLEHWAFWISTGIFCILIAVLKITQSFSAISNITVAGLCCIGAFYYIYYGLLD